jgi:hypothetical protein
VKSIDRTIEIACLLLLLFLIPTSAFADVIWPAVILEGKILTWPSIAVGLVIEFLFLKFLFGFDFTKAILADITMNLASTVLGILLIPIAGVLWEFVNILFHIHTFNPVTWAATFLLAVGVNAGIESLVVAKVFGAKIGQLRFWGLFVANLASVAVALMSLIASEPKWF